MAAGKITLGDVRALSARAKAVVAEARAKMLAPEEMKSAPLFSLSDVEAITGIPAARIRQHLRVDEDSQGRLPQGQTREELGEVGSTLFGRGQKRYYSAAEHARILRHLVPERFRPAGIAGLVISIFNYKGGVAKSTSCASLAQALSYFGYSVAVVDLDPQGSATNLFGYLQTFDVETADTALPVLSGTETSLLRNVRKTYWPGIDIVPSGPGLQRAEANFARDVEKSGKSVMLRMQASMAELKAQYDFVLIDTPPSLNNLASHALLNSDGVLVPCPPANVDLASLSMVWDLYVEACEQLGITDDTTPLFNFLRVFATKVEAQTRSARTVLDWLKDTYGQFMSSVIIPKSAAVTTAAESFGTVFDNIAAMAGKKSSSHDTVRTAYEQLAKEIIVEAQEIWAEKSVVANAA